MTTRVKSLIRSIPNFPKPGIIFRDITTLLKDAQGLRDCITLLTQRYHDRKIDTVVGVEARGFLLGTPLAIALGVGFVPVRKPKKLPAKTIGVDYALEYGTDRLEIHEDALTPGQKVLVVDDLLATGGTMCAAAQLVEKCGAEIVELTTLVELPDLGGLKRLDACGHGRWPIFTLLSFEGH
eukprot:TRINITY_DN36839_c0_g1_i1.p1 TRINITY_DN36839_c0_g1~~TRINITY_DN36839_c0_g1_i1.p1  ORF type:complete len:190 (+),score=42.17 TRINITY_DN36839_c0_g1_i1:29-571(+)